MKDYNATIIIDLTKSNEELENNIKREARKAVRKAIKSGIKFEESDDWSSFKKIYLKEWWCADSERILDKNLEQWKINKSKKLFFARKNSDIAGFAVIEFSGKKVILYRVLGREKFAQFRPTDFMYWNLIFWAKKNNYELLDFGGFQINAKGNLTGVNRFKMKFGGRIKYYEVKGSPFYILLRKIVNKFPFLSIIKRKIMGSHLNRSIKELKQQTAKKDK